MTLTENLPSIPAEYQPGIEDLPGDLSQLARFIEEMVPGQGVRVVLKLAEEYRGTSIYFHNLDSLKRRIRDIEIIRRYDNGERPADIARDVSLSERQVWKILGRDTEEDRQMRLF